MITTNINQKYATKLSVETYNYGEALWYFALSHKEESVRSVLDMLINSSLGESSAHPHESGMDDHLKRMMSSPQETLIGLSRMDIDAAELLRKTLSGYATLRKFYSLRDEEVLLPKGQRPKKSSLARKEEAVAALIAVISSADENICGGLYDEERDAIVNVDFLLALLGEVLPFVSQPDFTMTVSQIHTLLRAIEDIQTVGPRVYNVCSEVLDSVLDHYTIRNSSPSSLLQKSTSNLSGSSTFSLRGSSMWASQLKSMGSSNTPSSIKRGWDWRSGIKRRPEKHAAAEDLLRMLRLGLARDLGEAWILEVDNRG